MRNLLAALFLLIARAAAADPARVVETSYVLPDGSRVLRHSTVLPVSSREAWLLFTDPEKMRKFIAPVISIDLRPGGIWESSYNANATLGDPKNIRNEILAYLPERMLTIRIAQTPPGFPYPEIGKSVWTVIEFEPVDGQRTRVTTSMLPYRTGPGWDDLYRFFERGNATVFEHAWKFIQTGKPVWEEPKDR